MKKLRMIVASVIVLAIVGSAFSFKAKRANWCVSTDADTTCDVIHFNKKIVTTGGSLFNYFNGWDGNSSICANTNNCTSQVRLANN